MIGRSIGGVKLISRRCSCTNPLQAFHCVAFCLYVELGKIDVDQMDKCPGAITHKDDGQLTVIPSL